MTFEKKRANEEPRRVIVLIMFSQLIRCPIRLDLTYSNGVTRSVYTTFLNLFNVATLTIGKNLNHSPYDPLLRNKN